MYQYEQIFSRIPRITTLTNPLLIFVTTLRQQDRRTTNILVKSAHEMPRRHSTFSPNTRNFLFQKIEFFPGVKNHQNDEFGLRDLTC